MPYKNIVFVKLEKRLLNDHRWFSMSDKAQLLYVKLMLGCAETYNKLPTDSLTLRKQLRIEWRKDVFDSAIKEIQDNFPRFKKDGNFYYFEEFETKTNYIRECPSNAQELPKEVTDIDKEKEEEKDINKERLVTYWNTLLPTPKGLEREFIGDLLKQFGFEKSKRIIRQFAEDGFKKVKTMKNSLNPDGSIKPKDGETPKPHYNRNPAGNSGITL